MTDFMSVWLVPSPEALAPLQSAVDALALRNNSQTFLPHVTLLSGNAPSDQVINAVSSGVHGIFKGKKEVSLSGQITDVFLGSGESFHHTLGYKFSYNTNTTLNVNRLSTSILNCLGRLNARMDFVPDPHISMLYLNGQANHTDALYLKKLREVLPLQGKLIKFDTLMTVHGDHPIKCQRDVADWDARQSVALNGLPMPLNRKALARHHG